MTDPEPLLITARGAPLCLLEQGKGTPIVALHGLIASTHVFHPLIERARARVKVIAVDLPRSGRSGGYASHDPGQIAEVIAEVLEARGVKGYVVFGHSFGGVVAVELAARYPSRVKGLLLASAPALGLDGFKRLVSLPLVERLWHLAGKVTNTRPMLRLYLKFVFGNPALVTEEVLTAYQGAMAAEGSHAATFEAIRALASYQLPLAALRQYAGPRAVIWGEKDRLVPLVHGEQLALALGVPLQILHHAGHFLPQERPDDVWAALQPMLPKARATPKKQARPEAAPKRPARRPSAAGGRAAAGKAGRSGRGGKLPS